MNNITKLTYDSLNKYFNKLKYTGYLNSFDTNKLLILTFIEELLFDKFPYFVDNEDYSIIINALNTLYGSNCIIDIPDYDIYNHLIHDINIQESFRATEIGDARFSESENIRIEV